MVHAITRKLLYYTVLVSSRKSRQFWTSAFRCPSTGNIWACNARIVAGKHNLHRSKFVQKPWCTQSHQSWLSEKQVDFSKAATRNFSRQFWRNSISALLSCRHQVYSWTQRLAGRRWWRSGCKWWPYGCKWCAYGRRRLQTGRKSQIVVVQSHRLILLTFTVLSCYSIGDTRESLE